MEVYCRGRTSNLDMLAAYGPEQSLRCHASVTRELRNMVTFIFGCEIVTTVLTTGEQYNVMNCLNTQFCHFSIFFKARRSTGK